jgi:hypothetical protein
MRTGAAGLERVGYWLLKARPACNLAPAFNERRGALWVRMMAHRTAPKLAAFEAEVEELRVLLGLTHPAPGEPYDPDIERELSRILRCLEAVEAAAAVAGALG